MRIFFVRLAATAIMTGGTGTTPRSKIGRIATVAIHNSGAVAMIASLREQNLTHKLIVEVDGAGHDEESDAVRNEFLARSGFRVLRVKAWMVERHISVVLDVIRKAL